MNAEQASKIMINVDIGVQMKHSEKVSPVVTVILIAGGIGMMIAGGRGQAK